MVVDEVTGMPALNASDGTWASWFRLFVERANDLIYLHDVSGKILYINRKMEEVTGYRREELVGKNLLTLLGSASRVSAELRREHDPEDPEQGRRYEVEILCSDGSLVPVEVHSTPLLEGNTIVAWQGIARDIRERRRAQARLAAIYETSRQLVGILSLDDVLTTIVQRAAKITGAHSCSVWLAEKQNTLHCAAAHNIPADTQAACIERSSAHPIAQALREGRTTILSVDSADVDRITPGLPPGARTAICLPLEGVHGAVGVLSLSYTNNLGQDPDELAVLSTFASHAAAAIANARLFEAQHRKTQEAVAIGQIGMTAGSMDAEAALHVTGAYASDLFATDLAAMLVLEPGNTQLRVAYVTEQDEDESTTRYREPITADKHPLFAEALREQHTITVEDCATHPLTSEDPLFQDEAHSSIIVVPLLSGERALGALLLTYHTHTVLSDVQIRLAETLAQQAAVAYDNAMMFRRIAAAKQEWEATFNAITDPVCLFSRQGILLRANNAAAALLKAEPKALQGKHCHTLFYN
ncbi:MAG TPA: GAF domain-containing protein, partial [Armatimonadota bacterium]|nr:GAF domain-containing protein [Armatimonadota bacterium]